MVLSDDVSDDESTDDETESDGDYVEPREGDSENAEDAAWDDYCCNDVDATDSCFVGKDKTKWGKVKSCTHFRRGWQNILTKLPGVIGQTKYAATPFETELSH
jgi:7-cyano-7-deazaguanine synthase in queuosine biosynthesis